MAQIHFLNVKEGDCDIIKHNSGRVTVVDVCCARCKLLEQQLESFSPHGNFNQKEHPTNPIGYLKNIVKTNEIFRYIQTHPDMDHMDGIKDLFETFTVSNFWDTKNNKPKGDFSNRKYRKEDWNFYQQIRKSTENPRVLNLTDGASAEYYKQDGLFILAPSQQLVDEANETDEYNDASYVLLCQTEGRKIIFGGDSGEKTWNFILENYKEKVSNIDVLVAPHHGRKTGGNDEYLKTLNPKLTLFGNAESKNLDYASYNNRDLLKITNNEAGNIVLEIVNGEIDVYVSYQSFAKKFKSYNETKKFDAYFIGTI